MSATYSAHTVIGQREDLIDVIYSISPATTPIMSSVGKGSARAVYHEWQTDSLAAATTARKMGSLLSWIKTNSSVNGTSVTGVDPTTIGVSTRTDGTQRTFTETLLKELSLIHI